MIRAPKLRSIDRPRQASATSSAGCGSGSRSPRPPPAGPAPGGGRTSRRWRSVWSGAASLSSRHCGRGTMKSRKTSPGRAQRSSPQPPTARTGAATTGRDRRRLEPLLVPVVELVPERQQGDQREEVPPAVADRDARRAPRRRCQRMARGDRHDQPAVRVVRVLPPARRGRRGSGSTTSRWRRPAAAAAATATPARPGPDPTPSSIACDSSTMRRPPGAGGGPPARSISLTISASRPTIEASVAPTPPAGAAADQTSSGGRAVVGVGVGRVVRPVGRLGDADAVDHRADDRDADRGQAAVGLLDER